jgi:histidinol phosphatase-like PHP family hydrolase
MTIQNIVRQAETIGLQTIAFTEHVRKTSDWIPKYLGEIELVRSSVKIISGFEAKILADGSIDCPKEFAEKHFVVASFHTKYEDKQVWMNALKGAITNPDVDVIGHLAPESTFDLDPDELEGVARLIVENGKIVELNAKYHRPPGPWVRVFRRCGVRFHLGSDAHSVKEVGNFQSISDLMSIADGEGALAVKDNEPL